MREQQRWRPIEVVVEQIAAVWNGGKARARQKENRRLWKKHGTKIEKGKNDGGCITAGTHATE